MDTGSCVSTVSHSFYKKNLSNLSIQPLNDILNIECASGESLPYHGYIQANLESCIVGKNIPTLLLVVGDTPYNEKVPLLIGTNVLTSIMETCKEVHGDRMLQRNNIPMPWYVSFRCMNLRQKDLVRKNYCLGIVKSAESSTVKIPPNSQVTINGYADKELDYFSTTAFLQSCTDDDYDVTPSLLTY